jgi:hypothetical protein
LNNGLEKLFITSFGYHGSRWLSSTGTTVIGTFKEIHCIANTEFQTLEDSFRSTDSDSIAGLVIPSGVVLGGNFTKVQLKSGKVILYI